MTNEYIIRDEAMTLPVLPKEQRIRLDSIDEAFEEGWRQALENLAILPAADVVEVVKCRDCENWNTSFEQSYAGEKGHCQILDRISAQDFYCGCGKRKDGGQDDA